MSTSMGIRHAKTLRFAVRSLTKLGQRSNLVKSKPRFSLTTEAFPLRALLQHISSPINRWQGPQVIRDLAIQHSPQELFDPH
ncbi:hypothetical protein Tco_1245247 [Tanacetum coccineum]